MVRPSVLLASAACAILAACATTPPPPAEAQAEASAPVPDVPLFDWPAERSRIAAALAGSPDVAVQVRVDGTLQLMLAGADGFDRNGAEPHAALRATVERIAAVLADAPDTSVLVLGHTDSIGSEMYNLALSIRRAEAVMEHLRRHGVALTRLGADGRGEAEPIADNATPMGRAQNRRVEIIVSAATPPGQ